LAWALAIASPTVSGAVEAGRGDGSRRIQRQPQPRPSGLMGHRYAAAVAAAVELDHNLTASLLA
jgi:hypothetical protein